MKLNQQKTYLYDNVVVDFIMKTRHYIPLGDDMFEIFITAKLSRQINMVWKISLAARKFLTANKTLIFLFVI